MIGRSNAVGGNVPDGSEIFLQEVEWNEFNEATTVNGNVGFVYLANPEILQGGIWIEYSYSLHWGENENSIVCVNLNELIEFSVFGNAELGILKIGRNSDDDILNYDPTSLTPTVAEGFSAKCYVVQRRNTQ